MDIYKEITNRIIQNWLTVLRNDRKLIVSAAGKADKAVSLILGA